MGYTPPPAGSGSTTSSSSASNPFGAAQERQNFPVLTAPPNPNQAPHAAQVAMDLPVDKGTWSTAYDLTGQLYTKDPAEIATLQRELTLAGYGRIQPDGVVDAQTVSAYQDLLTDVTQYNKNGQALTPDMLLARKVAGENVAAGTSADGGTAGSTSFSFTDPNHARQMVKTALENRLGRDPNQAEISQFISTLHASEAAHPAHGTERYGGNGLPKSSVSTSSQVDAQSAADAFATSTQARANEAGQQSEIGFMQVLSHLLGVNAQGG